MRLRLVLAFTAIVLISVATVVLIARQGAAGAVRAFMFRGGMTGVQTLVTSLEAYYKEQGTLQGAGVLLESNRTQHGAGMGQGPGLGMMNQRLRLADAAGAILADTAQPSAGELSSAEMNASIPLEVDGNTVGYLLTEGGMNFTIENERALVNNITRAALIAGLIAGGLSLLLALLIAYSLLRPVQELTRAAGQMAQGDLTQRVQVAGNDEIASLGRAFNHMAQSLQRAEESRKSMTADIAHELRNPLAVQRASLEALQDGIYPMTPENLGPALEQNQLLNRLVEDLRTLALADAGQLTLERVPTDIASLAARNLERMRPQAGARQVSIHLTTPGEIPSVLADPIRLEQILGNLLSNSLRYTPAGGEINVSVSAVGPMLEVQVRDSGPGIPPDSLPYLFDRFYRADKSRTRQEGGTGLGLAIARQLARSHGGDLAAANHPGGGAVFTLSLPKTDPS